MLHFLYMADAGGGGATWEPFEIVLVILLVAGVLMHLQGKSFDTTPISSTSTQSEEIVNTPDVCGIQVDSPIPKQKVTNTIHLSGYTNGCNWPTKNGVMLYAQVVDAKGMPASVYTTVTGETIGHQHRFDTVIAITPKPAKGTGYLILVPLQDGTGRSQTLRIPITL